LAKKAVDEETVERAGSYSPEVERLIAKGKEQGYVTQQEIAGVLPEAEENLEELDELYAALLEQGVEITDQKDSLIWDKDDEEAPDTSDDYIKDIADECVRLY
jgi:RNA polymerase primary sigma factor